MVTLTDDQRLLLSEVWPGRMAWVLINPTTYIPLLKQSRAGGVWPPRDGYPEWFRSYDVGPKGIAGGPVRGEPHTFVAWAQLHKFARDLPDSVRVELHAAITDPHRGFSADRDALAIALGLNGAQVGQLELFGAPA